jgi:hypothetical protein
MVHSVGNQRQVPDNNRKNNRFLSDGAANSCAALYIEESINLENQCHYTDTNVGPNLL